VAVVATELPLRLVGAFFCIGLLVLAGGTHACATLRRWRIRRRTSAALRIGVSRLTAMPVRE
jgi:hypothetical protein